MTRKAYRAKMRAKHGADWWKAKKPKAKLKAKTPTPIWRRSGGASHAQEWAGFPRLAGGMVESSLLEPDSKPGDPLVYSDMDQAGASSWGVTVVGVATLSGDTYTAFEWGGHEDEYDESVLLTGASRAEAIRFVKGLKGYEA